jgi:hyperosmotically inducible protein
MRRRGLSLLFSLLFASVALAQTPALPGRGVEPTQRIARETMHELLMLPYYSVFDNLSFRVDGNTVTLLGQVLDGATKSDAEARVKKIEGVDRVVNNIEMLPPSPMDDRIRREEYRAIYGSDGLYKYGVGAVPSIHIVVKNGHVTLVGVVDNDADKNMAGIRSNSVPGVFSVDNQLQVENQRTK